MPDKKKTPLKRVGPAENREKSLKEALADIEKEFGKGSIMRMGDAPKVNVEAIPTGSLSLDMALGVGGLPKGRIVEIYGPESCGKTTLALHVVASAQKMGGEVAFVDAEHALEPAYARALGVDIDKLLISQPDTGEQALDITNMLVRSGAVDLVVVDSVAALTPRAEIEGHMGDTTVGAVARLMSHALRKLASSISKTNCIVIFINQIREKIGVTYGSPETTPGGRALRYFSSVRIDVRRGEALKDSTEQLGNRTKATIKKNKVAPPFKVAEFDIIYGEGISRLGELVDLGVQTGCLERAGSWFTLGEQRFQGKDNLRAFLKENKELADKLEADIRQNAEKLLTPQAKAAAIAAGRVVDVTAEDFDDE